MEDVQFRRLNYNERKGADFLCKKLGAKINQNLLLHLGEIGLYMLRSCVGALISVQICTADASRLGCNLVHRVRDCENGSNGEVRM